MTVQQAMASAREAERAVSWLIEHEQYDAAELLRYQIERTMLCALRRSISLVDIAAYAAVGLAVCFAC